MEVVVVRVDPVVGDESAMEGVPAEHREGEGGEQEGSATQLPPAEAEFPPISASQGPRRYHAAPYG